MKNEYFVPDMEDLRIGYECKIFSYLSGKYEKEILDNDLLADIVRDNTYTFKTPYLTKEQIEAEGWEYWKEGPSADGCSFIKNKYSCQMLIPGNIQEENAGVIANFVIYQRETHHCLFLGECKSINEFRYICKLLKI